MPDKALGQNKRRLKLGIAMLPFLLLALLATDILFWGKPAEHCPDTFRHDQEIVINNRTIGLEKADNDAERTLGLSGRDCIDNQHGMLFVFDQPVAYCFWMKDMKFPIDIIWVNTAKQVVDIKHDVSPSSYPKNFCPSLPAQYVIEMKSGQAEKLNIKAGTTLPL